MISSFSHSIRRARQNIRLRPFDVSTPEGRASERERRAMLSTMVAMGAKLVSVSTQLITVPLTLRYLGAERFGLWMTISSVIAMLAFADLGIGNGLLNAISAANGRDDAAAIRRYISSAAFMLTSISLLVMGGLASAYTVIPWPALFNVHTPVAMAEAGPAAAAFIVCFAVNIPATIVQRVQLGLQMGFVANLWQAGGSLVALAAVLSAVHLHASLQWLVLAFAGAPVIAAAINGLTFFGLLRPDLLPRISLANRPDALRVMKTGLLFLVLQIVVAVTYSSDNFIIAHILGASAVTVYAVPDKMFSVIPIILSMLLSPLWPAYGEAISRGDHTWVRQIFRKSLLMSLAISVPISLAFVIFGERIIALWVGHVVNVPILLLLGFGLWKVIEATGNTFAVYLNGANVVGLQVKVSIVTAVTGLCLKFYLINTLGISGAIWATITCFSLFSLLPFSIRIKRVIFSPQTSAGQR